MLRVTCYMINFLHTFTPEPILISFGPITVYWYGLFIVSGILAAMLVALKLAEHYQVGKNEIIDIAFWSIITGVIGARIYHVGLEFPYYWDNPEKIIKIWEGGLAIHGALLFGGLTAWFLVRKYNINFWKLASIVVPGIALGQAIGRWGNYFNQEVYGLPTTLPWGIPIDQTNRLAEYYFSNYFHPTFLYESIGNFCIFLILISAHIWVIKNKKQNKVNYSHWVTAYISLYSVLRFFLEFIRTDPTPEIWGLRWPQIVSISIVISVIIVYIVKNKRKTKDLSNI